MIEKMNFVSITGPKDDIDRIVDRYLSKYEIQLEYAPSELKSISTLYPYVEQNPYKEQAGYAQELAEVIGIPEDVDSDLTPKESSKLIEELYNYVKKSYAQRDKLVIERDILKEKLNKVLPFKNVNYNIENILNFKNMRFRFGLIPK